MKIEEINSKEKYGFSCIYLWKNLINDKVYVGQTQNFYQRMKQYQRGNDVGRVVGKALAKYGFDNFEVFILEQDVPIANLDAREQYWLDFYKCYDSCIGYNVCQEASTTRGYRHSEDSKRKMSEKTKKRFRDHPEYAKAIGDRQRGKKASQTTKDKMSQSRLGNQNAKGSHWKMTEESKKKISQALKGKQNCLGHKHTQETKDKIAESNRNRTVSEETRRKISEANKGKTVKKVRCIDTNIIYNSMIEASEKTGVKQNGISHCCRGKQKTAGGYRWEYYID